MVKGLAKYYKLRVVKTTWDNWFVYKRELIEREFARHAKAKGYFARRYEETQPKATNFFCVSKEQGYPIAFYTEIEFVRFLVVEFGRNPA